MSELETIVTNQRGRVCSNTTARDLSWNRGFEIGLEHARANLEVARSEPLFIVLMPQVPTAETQSQLLFSFMEVIYDEIEEYRKKKWGPPAVEEPASNVVTAVSCDTTIPVIYSMTDGVKQWISGKNLLKKWEAGIESLRVAMTVARIAKPQKIAQ